ncbi:MAG: pirin family protein [Paludibacter sp.]|nr:pirin family protein [Paludibacter sp.]
MKTVIHKAATRGQADHGWLKTHHTFSFANYYNPERVHFGTLRVLNDDWIDGGEGFGKHPHDNMEIITIPLKGAVQHQDSIGNKGVINAGEIQVMSAGTGIYHSEYNANKNLALELLQIWVFPDKKNVTPRYEQISLTSLEKSNEFYPILSPNADDAGVWIHQQAWFHLGDLSAGWEGNYNLKSTQSGVYVFIIEGEATVAGIELSRRDGIGISETQEIEIKAKSDSKILIMEVPMN